MHHQTLISCANCWFNGLQYGSVGLSFGYCTEHRLVLRKPDETTCGRQVRKDFLLYSAKESNRHHQKSFSKDIITTFDTKNIIDNREFIEKDNSFISHDDVGSIVAEYGEYDSKIESLSQLRSLKTFRSEFALLSLGRAYADRCVVRGGSWTSGIHLFWWIKRRLINAELAEPMPSDLRYSTSGSLQRQVELASWSLLMFRLTFISDLGIHSRESSDSIDELSEIAEQAALDTEIPSKRKLLAWINKKGKQMLESAMPEQRYKDIRHVPAVNLSLT
jgi:hypothetical protein